MATPPEGLTDEKIAMNHRCGGGSVVAMLIGKRKPGLAEIRNTQAHGHPFDTMSWAGVA
jgi:hypothetical protein